jgi:hypothetical protein
MQRPPMLRPHVKGTGRTSQCGRAKKCWHYGTPGRGDPCTDRRVHQHYRVEGAMAVGSWPRVLSAETASDSNPHVGADTTQQNLGAGGHRSEFSILGTALP